MIRLLRVVAPHRHLAVRTRTRSRTIRGVTASGIRRHSRRERRRLVRRSWHLRMLWLIHLLLSSCRIMLRAATKMRLQPLLLLLLLLLLLQLQLLLLLLLLLLYLLNVLHLQAFLHLLKLHLQLVTNETQMRHINRYLRLLHLHLLLRQRFLLFLQLRALLFNLSLARPLYHQLLLLMMHQLLLLLLTMRCGSVRQRLHGRVLIWKCRRELLWRWHQRHARGRQDSIYWQTT